MSYIEAAAGEDDEGLEDISVEDRARALGWKPQPQDPRSPQPGEFRGDPRHWTDAETFLRRGNEEMPIMREQNNRLTTKQVRMEREMGELKKTVEEQGQALKDAMALARRADQGGYERARAELVAQRRAAAEAGEADVVDQVSEQIEAMETERRRVETPAAVSPPPPPPPPPPPAPSAWVASFMRENPWMTDDTKPHLRNSMVAFHKQVIAENPGSTEEACIPEALERMYDAFPALAPLEDGEEAVAREEPPEPAPRPRPRQRPAVATPSGPRGEAPQRPGSDPFLRIADADERREAKGAFDRLRAHDDGLTAGEYMQLYDNPHLDALELRKQRRK